MNQRSKCCNLEAKTDIADEGTGCYMCVKCGKPCDMVADKTKYHIVPEEWVKAIVEILEEEGEDGRAQELKLMQFRFPAIEVPDQNKCKFYMSGMDTSGRCNNCGKHQYEH